MSDWAETNRRKRDERVPIHLAPDFYDVAGFKAGLPSVEPFEIDELGALGGIRLAHLQCHLGLDTLDLVRLHPTLEAVGLDSSGSAVAAATGLADELGLSDRAKFVKSDVYRASAVLGQHSFDVVYTGKGALIRLPDLEEWAAECANLLRPGGCLYVCEFHPVGMCLGYNEPKVEFDYFNTDPIVDDTPGAYADLQAETVENLSYEWDHQLGRILNAVLEAGLELRFFHEWDYTLFELNRWLIKGKDGRYRWPGPAKLPLMYSLKAQRR